LCRYIKEKFIEDYRNSIAAASGIDPSAVVIGDIVMGSVIVKTSVTTVVKKPKRWGTVRVESS
jgi:hypothetical protein